jgi:hypothetical protein
MSETPPEFVFAKDHERLRAWLKALRSDESLKMSGLETDFGNWLRQHKVPAGSVSRQAITSFMEGKTKAETIRWAKAAEPLWRFLYEHPNYRKHLRGASRDDGEQTPGSFDSWEHALHMALSWFLQEGEDYKHKRSILRLQQYLTGRYVMYRQDLEPAAQDMPPAECIRASLVEIVAATHGLSIKETQDFPKTKTRDRHYQVNTGVVLPYGDYVIALMNGDHGDGYRKKSFKCLIINKIIPVSDRIPAEEFKGKLLVASDIALFPSARVICKRVPANEHPNHHGIIAPKAVDKNVRLYLAKPTFDEKYKIVY